MPDRKYIIYCPMTQRPVAYGNEEMLREFEKVMGISQDDGEKAVAPATRQDVNAAPAAFAEAPAPKNL